MRKVGSAQKRILRAVRELNDAGIYPTGHGLTKHIELGRQGRPIWSLLRRGLLRDRNEELIVGRGGYRIVRHARNLALEITPHGRLEIGETMVEVMERLDEG